MEIHIFGPWNTESNKTSHIAQPREVNKDHRVPRTRAGDLINIQYEGTASSAYRHSFSRINGGRGSGYR